MNVIMSAFLHNYRYVEASRVFMSQLSASLSPVRCGLRNDSVGLEKHHDCGLKCPFWSPQSWLQMPLGLLKSIQWFHTYDFWKDSLELLGTGLADLTNKLTFFFRSGEKAK